MSYKYKYKKVIGNPKLDAVRQWLRYNEYSGDTFKVYRALVREVSGDLSDQKVAVSIIPKISLRKYQRGKTELIFAGLLEVSRKHASLIEYRIGEDVCCNSIDSDYIIAATLNSNRHQNKAALSSSNGNTKVTNTVPARHSNESDESFYTRLSRTESNRVVTVGEQEALLSNLACIVQIPEPISDIDIFE